MNKLCVIGDPVLHSKSPLIQNTMIQALGLDYDYVCQPVKREELPAWLDRVRAEGWAGFNATMPHKEALVPYMDELDEDAKLYGAVNTVCYRNGKLYGVNTDGGGFARALTMQGIPIKGTRFALLGAGGAAKAGETSLQAVVRELYEETGIRAKPEEFELIGSGRDSSNHYDYYCLKNDTPIESIVLLPGETDDVKWVTFPQVHEMIEKKQICRVIAAQFLKQEPFLKKRQE